RVNGGSWEEDTNPGSVVMSEGPREEEGRVARLTMRIWGQGFPASMRNCAYQPCTGQIAGSGKKRGPTLRWGLICRPKSREEDRLRPWSGSGREEENLSRSVSPRGGLGRRSKRAASVTVSICMLNHDLGSRE